ncbi:MAG: hypothetical protein JO055_15215 [Alphaproteobacteria bacterium]|nr:hypothetical protein [Alphaproteobacteria bacterium]
MTKLGLVYLDRALNPARFARRFARSVIDAVDGVAAELHWQAKGYPDGRRNPMIARLERDWHGTVHEHRYPEGVFQFFMGFDVAAKTDCDVLVFFTSTSEILSRTWLRACLESFDRVPGCGVIGATGSYETSGATVFPNVHIRTNAFMMERKRFLELDAGDMSTLESGNAFEAGPQSLTRQLDARGLKPIVVDRDGRRFHVDEWPRSRTFRSGGQEALAVSDSRTFDYASGSPGKRRWLAELSWGDAALPSRADRLERLRMWADWRWRGVLFDR